MIRRASVLSALVGCLLAFAAGAHETRPPIATLTLGADGVARLDLLIDVETTLSGRLATETPETVAAYDALRALDPEGLNADFASRAAAFLAGFDVAFDGARSPLVLGALRVPPVGDPAALRFSTLLAEAPIPPGAGALRWAAPAALGDTVVRIVAEGGDAPLFAALLPAGAGSPEVSLGGLAATAVDFVGYVKLGFEHIVPKGLDHILFVVGLFLLNPRPRPLLIQVSMFTLAHSITLALGIYGVVAIPAEIVEPLIAASIVFIALENISGDRLRPWRPAVVFGFGLLHGLGFAGVLAEIGLPPRDFAQALVGFNIGVELGQLAVLALCFLGVGLWFGQRSWYRATIAMPASVAIALVGAWWFVERI